MSLCVFTFFALIFVVFCFLFFFPEREITENILRKKTLVHLLEHWRHFIAGTKQAIQTG